MQAPFELRTPRTRLRPLGRDDRDEFTRYRNIDSVARFQDWPLPYTSDLADELIDSVEQMGCVTPDEWFQVGVETSGRLIGDVALWIDHSSQLAVIGFTLAPEHQGNGYATEAVHAAIDHLVEHVGVHRITATIDPANVASARLLKRLGFRYEGRAVAAAYVRNAWLDDDRYAILADEWKDARSRDLQGARLSGRPPASTARRAERPRRDPTRAAAPSVRPTD